MLEEETEPTSEPFHARRIQDEVGELEERDDTARRHFPHLSASVAPRESDETPTYWED